MKKTITIILIILCILSINTVYGVEVITIQENAKNEIVQENNQNVIEEEDTIQKNEEKDIVNIRDEMEFKKQMYTEKYGSDAYWVAGYIIEEIVQPYSIPLCFAGIAMGLVFQYVMGTRRLDYKHRGFGTVIIFVTILIVCQVLPFIYALVVTGWRG